MPDLKLNTEGADLSVFKTKPTDQSEPIKLNTEGVDLSVFKPTETQEQPLTYMQKELRQKFPENYQPTTERETSYIPEVTGEGKQLMGSIPATNPDLSAKHPEYFAPKISDSYKAEKPTVIPQGTGNKFQAIDQKQLEKEVGGAQISQDLPLTEVDQLKVDYTRKTRGDEFAEKKYQKIQELYKSIPGWQKKSELERFGSGVESGWENMKGGLKYTTGAIAEGFDKLDGESDMDFDNRMYESARQNFNAAPKGDGIMFEVGSFMPQMVGIAAATLSSIPTAGTSLSAVPVIIGGANIAALVGSSAGSAMNEYDKYMEEVGEEGNYLAKISVGIGAGAAEYFAEKLGLKRYLPEGTIAKTATKFLIENPDVAAAIGKKISKEALQEFGKHTGKNMLEEGGEEFITEFGQSLIENLYRKDEDDLSFGEIFGRSMSAARGGALMGGMMSPISYGSQKAIENKNNKPITGQPSEITGQLPDTTPQLTVDPKFTAEQQARANIEQIIHNDGNVQTFLDPKGNEFAILSETPGGMAVVINQSGNKSTMAVSDIRYRKVQTPDKVLAEQMQLFDQENQPKEQDTFNFNGKKYNVVDFAEDGSWIAEELDENGQPTGEQIQVTQEDQQKVLEQLQANPQQEPQLNTIEVGKTKYTFTPGENNSLKSEVYNSVDAAEKARADIETVLGSKNDIAIIKTENPDPMQPDAFTVSVTPKTNLSEKEGENIEFDSLLPNGDNGLKADPTETLFSETEQEEPKTSKIVTQKVGSTSIDIIENEDYDEVVPTDKVPFEKALPALEKKFKDNPKFELQVDKEVIEIPGKVIKGETKWDEDVVEPSTKQTVIKSIRIVPKEVIERKKKADTDILLDILDEFNATPQSREDKQEASEIESIAKQLGYQTDKNASNQIRIFDKTGTIEREKKVSEVTEKKNLKSDNTEKVSEITDQLFENQEIKNEEIVKNEQKVKSKNNINEKSLQNGNENNRGIKGTSRSGEPIRNGSGGTNISAGTSQFDELLQSGNEPVVLPGGSGKGNQDIGTGKHPKQKVKPSNSITGKAKEVEVAETDFNGLALKYFVDGGKVAPSEIKRLLRDSETESSARFTYRSNDEGLTIDKIAHDIWENLPEQIKDNVGAMDITNAVEDVIMSHNSPVSMAKALLEKYSEDTNQGYSKEWLTEQVRIEDEERQFEIDSWTDYLTELEKSGQLPTENEIIELFLPENTENGNQEINQRGSIGENRPVNPEGNGKIGQDVQGSKPRVQGENEKGEVENKEPWMNKPNIISGAFPNSIIQIPVFHGSREQFDDFDESLIGKNDEGVFGKGIYLSENKSNASQYGGADYANVKAYEVDIQKPYIVNFNDEVSVRDARKLLLAKQIPSEYDGVIVYESGKMNEVVVRSKSQLKRITTDEDIWKAYDEGKYDQAIKDGKITEEQAKDIVEFSGIKYKPKKTLADKKQSTPLPEEKPVQENKPIFEVLQEKSKENQVKKEVKSVYSKGDNVRFTFIDGNERIGIIQSIEGDKIKIKSDGKIYSVKGTQIVENGDNLVVNEPQVPYGVIKDINNDPNLVVVHNLREEGLLNADKIGGLAMPSLAVVNVNHGFSSYGDITLIADKDLIDPKKNKASRVFASDVYSARYPKLNYSISKGGMNDMIKKINSVLAKELASTFSYNIENDIENKGLKELQDSRYAKVLFLKDGDHGFKYEYNESKIPDRTKQAFLDNGWNNLEYFEISDNIEAKKRLTDIYLDRYKDDPKQQSAIKERLLDENGIAKGNLLPSFIQEVKREMRESGKIDLTETLRSASNFIVSNGLENQFKNYAKNLYDGLGVTEKIFKGWDSNGNKKYTPHTLENVLKEMKKNGVRAGESSFYGSGSVRAKVTPEFKSIKDIQSKRGSITNNFEAVKEEANDGLFEVLDVIRPFYKYDGSDFGYSQDAAEELIPLSKNGSSDSFKQLPTEIHQQVSDYLTKLAGMQTEYFEAKIGRGVSLGEFKTALIPSDLSQEAKDVLKFNGINIIEYKNQEDRAEKLKNASALQLFEPKSDYLRKQEINLAYGSEELYRTAIEKTVELVEPALLNERDMGRPLTIREPGSSFKTGNSGNGILSKILPRTVFNTFRESGSVDVVGRRVFSTQDIADLWTIHRSPYIEKSHIVFLKNGEIIGTTCHSLNKSGETEFLDPQAIAKLYNWHGADEMYFVHNHPSGNHKTSVQDVRATLYQQYYFQKNNPEINFTGHVVIDHSKYSFIPSLKSSFYFPNDYKDQISISERYMNEFVWESNFTLEQPKLFTERENINANEDAVGRMAEIGSALINEKGYHGVIVYLSPNLDINAYDVFPEGVKPLDVIRLINEGLSNNLGQRYVIVHDGSYKPIGLFPYGLADIINTKTGYSDDASVEPKQKTQLRQLWEPKTELQKLNDNPEGMFGYMKERNLSLGEKPNDMERLDSSNFEELARKLSENVFAQLDISKKPRTISFLDHEIQIEQERGYQPDFYLDGEYLSDLNFSGAVDRDEQIDELTYNIKFALKDQAERIIKPITGRYNIESEIDRLLKLSNIEYKKINAVKTQSVYYKTNNGTLRVSDHKGQFREYEDVKTFIWTDENYSTELLKNAVDELKSQPDNTILINGVSRPTLNSNGKPIANSEEGIRNFYKWFQNSKVTDEQGKPLVVSLPDSFFPVLSGKSSMPESSMDGLGSYAKFITDLFKSKAFIDHGLSGFNIPTQNIMLESMIKLGDNNEIVNSIIELIPVNVMNFLRSEKLSADMIFHDKTMLEKVFSVNTNTSIPVTVDIPNSLAIAITNVITEVPSIFSDKVFSDTKDSSAKGTSNVYLLSNNHDDNVLFANINKFNDNIKLSGNNGSFDPNDNNILNEPSEEYGKKLAPGETLWDRLTRKRINGPEFESVNPEVNKRMKAARGLGSTPFGEKVKEIVQEIKEQVHHFKHITEDDFPSIYNKLRLFEAIPDRVRKEAFNKISTILRPIAKNKVAFEAFERYIVLRDLVSDINSGLFEGKELPWGYNSKEEVIQDDANIQLYVANNPILRKAINERNKMMKEVRELLIENGLLDAKAQDKENYFHHQVLVYMAKKEPNMVGVSSKDVRNHRKGWQRSRTGSMKDYNTNYLESEFEVLAQSLEQLEIRDILRKIGKEADIMPSLVEMANKEGGKWKDYIPEGFRPWYPKAGTNAYKAASLAEKAIQNLIDNPVAADMIEEMSNEVERTMWVIDERLADQLNSMKDPEKENPLGKVGRKINSTWKQWMLLNPYSVIKYNFNNMSGDIDIVMAYSPAILKPQYAHTAMKEAWNDLKGLGMSQDMKEALQHGVITSGLSIQEIPDINKEGVFKSLTGSDNLLMKYWNNTKDYTQFRENMLRLAAYKYFKDQLGQGKNLYAASNRKAIDSLTDINEKAGKLARELIGDYGNLSQGGQWLRMHIFPFWSWVEINSPRYYRLLKNTKFEESENTDSTGRIIGVGAAKTLLGAGKLSVKMLLLMGLVTLWNRLMFPDEDDELTKTGNRKLMLIVGRREDSTIMTVRMQGAFSDMLSFLGLEDATQDVEDISKEKATISKKAKESGSAFVNKFAQGIMPVERSIIETALGKNLYPDVFNPRTARDRPEILAKAWKMDKIYRYITKKAMRDMGKEMTSLLVYDNDPGQAAYYTMRQRIYDFLDEKEVERPDGDPTQKSNALYYYKQSLKLENTELASYWLAKYRELGGTTKGMKASIEKGEVRAALPKKYRGEFYRSLDEEDKEVLQMADEWYNLTYRGKK